MADIHESGEDYLEAILRIEAEKGKVRSIDVAKKLGVSKPSVSRAMGILVEHGYLSIPNSGNLELTEKGRKTANKIYARHILLTNFLVKITGVSVEQAEENACRIEHDIDEDVRNGIRAWMEKNSCSECSKRGDIESSICYKALDCSKNVKK